MADAPPTRKRKLPGPHTPHFMHRRCTGNRSTARRLKKVKDLEICTGAAVSLSFTHPNYQVRMNRPRSDVEPNCRGGTKIYGTHAVIGIPSPSCRPSFFNVFWPSECRVAFPNYYVGATKRYYDRHKCSLCKAPFDDGDGQFCIG